MSYMNTSNQLAGWVLDQCQDWRDHRDTNYLELWKEYERLWRGIWAAEDRTRESERAKLVTPALQQAIETHVAEIEEAVFGRGERFFDISDDFADKEKIDIEQVKNQLVDDFKRDKVRKSISDIILMSAVYGTGIGEIVLKEKKELRPATRPIVEMGLTAVGVEEKTRFCVQLKPVNPKNFLIEPTAATIEDSLGCAIEEFVSLFSVVQAMEAGVYEKVPNFGSTAVNSDLEPVQEDVTYQQNRVKLLRYYGLVPRKLLENAFKNNYIDLGAENEDDLGSDAVDFSDLVEAIIVVANDQYLLKAEESPYMMQDRPVVAFQNDTLPNYFWGRGVAEKGFNMQKAIDAQIRSHLDSLALTTVPMMGIDATRLPRGSKFEVRPGKSILTNGNPAEILQPFKFGNTDPNNLVTAKEFERMMLMATGTIDSFALPAATTGEGAGLSPGLSAIIKKNKRTLVNFQEQFLIPFVTKAAYRYMQFDPEKYPASDYEFVPSSNLGIIAREYEQLQFINLLKTLGPESPIVPMVMKAVIENSGLANREEMVQQLEQMMQPNPEQQQMQQAGMQLQLQKAQLEIADLEADVTLKQAKAQNEITDAELKPAEIKAKVAAAASKYLGDSNDPTKEFERRLKLANVALKEKDINTRKEIAELQLQSSRK
jgi:hypothetical protein